MNIPEELKYTESHEWIAIAEGVATVGITHHAQEELSELVYVELPDVGKIVSKGDPVAVVESVKAASDIYAPVSGEVVAGNDDLSADPPTLNTDPYGSGWIFKIKVSDESDLDALLDAAAYEDQIG
jgi:glycine cleavage system H protein